MKKGLIKAAVLLTVFITALVVSGKVTNKNHQDLTTEMAEVTLPVVVLYNENEQINELHGYTAQMNAAGMRDTITPLSSSKEIPLQIKTYGYRVDSISYEIRSINGERLISDGTISSIEESSGQIQTSIPVQSLLEQSREYVLTLKLKQDERVCYYYTRIADAKDCYAAESVRFAQKINALTFSEDSDELSIYWEPNITGDNSSLHKVTINSSLAQAGWADFKCSKLTEPVPSIKEMNSSFNVIMLNYVVTSNEDDGALEYYNVEEYYRIRYTSERMYLLNFERTMNRIFNGENDFLYDNYLQLGIRSKEVEYKKNEAGTITCFVQEGDLWSYNQASGRLAEVFSFRRHEGIDARENYMQHDIYILNVDEAGSMDYAVYGYMNRGAHEGRTGICFLHYDSLTNTNEERLFVSYDKSYEILKAELGKLLYENAAGGIYLMFNGSVFHTDLESLEMEEIAGALEDGSYAVSQSNRYFAWISDQDSKEISVMDLETSKIEKITAKKGQSLRVLGFMQEDLVYGIAAQKHRLEGDSGIEQFPMYALRIVNAQNTQILKKYRKKGYYIDSIEVNDGVLILNRMTLGENGYEQAQQDSIVNRSREETQEVIHTTTTDVKQQQVQLTLMEMEQETTPVYVAAKQVVNQEDKETVLKTEQDQQNYFAYGKGRVQAASTDISKAIRSADENMGVVVDAQQNYIWKRDRKNIQPPLEVRHSEADADSPAAAKCVSAMLKREGIEVGVNALLEKGDSPQDILESLLSDRPVIRMENCTLTQVFYYVSCGMPVLAAAGTQEMVLITGYDALNVWLYDPQGGGTVKETIEDAQARFGTADCVFIACLPE